MEQKKLFKELYEKYQAEERELTQRHWERAIIYLIMLFQFGVVGAIVMTADLVDTAVGMILSVISLGVCVIALLGLLKFYSYTKTNHKNWSNTIGLRAIGELLREEFGDYTEKDISKLIFAADTVVYSRGLMWSAPDRSFLILRARELSNGIDSYDHVFDGVAICVPEGQGAQRLWNIEKTWDETVKSPMPGKVRYDPNSPSTVIDGQKWIKIGFDGWKPEELLAADDFEGWCEECLKAVHQIKWILETHCKIEPEAVQPIENNVETEKKSDSDSIVPEKKKKNRLPILIIIAAALMLIPMICFDPGNMEEPEEQPAKAAEEVVIPEEDMITLPDPKYFFGTETIFFDVFPGKAVADYRTLLVEKYGLTEYSLMGGNSIKSWHLADSETGEKRVSFAAMETDSGGVVIAFVFTDHCRLENLETWDGDISLYID